MKPIIFRRKYRIPLIDLKNNRYTIIIIDPIERMLQREKTTTIRSHYLRPGTYRILLDFKPTYYDEYNLSLFNVKREIWGKTISDQQIINDLGLRKDEIELIEKHSNLQRFFYFGYKATFPNSKVKDNDPVYLYQVKPIKPKISQKLDRWT